MGLPSIPSLNEDAESDEASEEGAGKSSTNKEGAGNAALPDFSALPLPDEEEHERSVEASLPFFEDHDEEDAVVNDRDQIGRSESIVDIDDRTEQESATNAYEGMNNSLGDAFSVSSSAQASVLLSSGDEEAYLTLEEVEDGWVIDERTGAKYKKIAKQKFGGTKKEPIPVPDHDVMDEITDPYDINDSAVKFLSHLQVVPDQKEMKRIKEERAAARKKKNQKYKEEILMMQKERAEKTTSIVEESTEERKGKAKKRKKGRRS